jgi:hypothetical protein
MARSDLVGEIEVSSTTTPFHAQESTTPTALLRLLGEKQLQDEVVLIEWCNVMDLLAVVSKRKDIKKKHTTELSVYRLSLQHVFSTLIHGDIYCMAWRPDGAEIVLAGKGSLKGRRSDHHPHQHDDDDDDGEENDIGKLSRHDVFHFTYQQDLTVHELQQPMLWIIDVEHGDLLRTCSLYNDEAYIERIIWVDDPQFGRIQLPEDDLFGEFLSKFPGNYVISEDLLDAMPKPKDFLRETQTIVNELGKGV